MNTLRNVTALWTYHYSVECPYSPSQMHPWWLSCLITFFPILFLQIQDNISLFCQARDNIQAILNEYVANCA